ncbi:uncharacterized protein [Coffea arabica]|uniref:Uncharacterized protein isoform X2 n=1 Tax=Coffea arabica TaxID=13443 RepID=A0A6P6SMF0_COFAR|nr:uncharacterized protein LOC113692729 isoform X2 [Coffea arabica]
MFLWHWLTKSPAPEADLYQFVSRIITPFVGNTFVVVPLLPSAIAFVFSAVMETLAASSAKLLVYVENQNPRDKQTSTGFSCQAPTTRAAAAAAARSRPEIRFLRYLNKHANFGYSSSLSLSFHRKTIHPISSVPALSQTSAGIEEIRAKDTTQFKSVHVKFQLQRECLFGQQFLIVGDDPMFGLWDPSNAIPLNWSEGHVWTVEMDIPCDKVMKYKFILKRGDDTILWQPGPDRILRTLETWKTITVCEDWDNAELQTLIEEDPVAHQELQTLIEEEDSVAHQELQTLIEEDPVAHQELQTLIEEEDSVAHQELQTLIKEDPVAHQLTESRENSEKLTVVGNLLQPSGDPEALASTNGYAQPATKPLSEKPVTVPVENKIEQHEEQAVEFNEFAGVSFSSNPNEIVSLGVNDHPNFRRSESTENFTVPKDEKKLDTSAAMPVLVPGLTPKPTADIEESSASKADPHISTASSVGSYKSQDFSVPEINLVV